MRRLIIIGACGISALCVSQAEGASPYISEVFEFCPAPGQFVNDIPTYEEGTGEAGIMEEVRLQLCGDKKPGMVSLGMFGGYVTFGFDHQLVNVAGEYDFKIYGNSFHDGHGSNAEPGTVWVSADANGNRLPDDPWYELAGSEYDNPATIKGYQITYYRPAAEPTGEEPEYIRWTSNNPQNPEGWLRHNMFHRQSYWPGWSDAESLTFEGTLLPPNGVKEGSNWILNSFAWGYADNQPDNEYEGFKLDWAVDSRGERIHLPAVDFIRVQCAQNQYCGALGETSTEICGAEDLHPDATPQSGVTSAADAASGPRLIAIGAGYAEIYVAEDSEGSLYSLDGRQLRRISLAAGVNRIEVGDMGLQGGMTLLRVGSEGLKLNFRR